VATTYDLNSEQTVADARKLWEMFRTVAAEASNSELGTYTDPAGTVHEGRKVHAYQRRLWTAAFPQGDSASGTFGSEKLRRMSASSRLKLSGNVVHLEPGVKDRPSAWFVRDEWNDVLFDRSTMNGRVIVALPNEERDDLVWEKTDAGLYKCKKCPYTAPSSASVVSHCARTSGEHAQLSAPCIFNDCPYVVTSWDSLSQHVSRFHNDAMDGRMICSTCGALANNRSEMMRHRSDVHPRPPAEDLPAASLDDMLTYDALAPDRPAAAPTGSPVDDLEAVISQAEPPAPAEWTEDERALAELFVGLLRSGVRRQAATMDERVRRAEQRAEAAEQDLSSFRAKARTLFGEV
jgi:hypothetical protein